MVKYDQDFKLKVVIAYLNGECGYKSIAKQYGIPNTSQIQRWAYQMKEYTNILKDNKIFQKYVPKRNMP